MVWTSLLHPAAGPESSGHGAKLAASPAGPAGLGSASWPKRGGRRKELSWLGPQINLNIYIYDYI